MRTQKNTPAVLLYQLPEFSMQGRAVRTWLAERGIRAVSVGPDDSGKTLSTLLGLKREADGPKRPLPGEPMVVLYGLVGPTFDDFLTLLDGTGRIALKAAATPYNLHWTFGKLAEQLQDERQRIG